MRAITTLLLLVIPSVASAHPGGGLIALDANTVIFGDSMYNAVWRLEKGKKQQALMKNFHAHWTTRGMDGQIYSESFQEIEDDADPSSINRNQTSPAAKWLLSMAGRYSGGPGNTAGHR